MKIVFSFVKSIKNSIILKASFQLKLYRLTSSCTVLNAMMRCIFTDNYDSSLCFWVFKKRLTQENCFLFCKKYGLFNGFIFLTIKKFYFPILQTFMVSVQGEQDLSISYGWSRIVSAMERVRSKNLYTNNLTRNELWNFRLMVLRTLALIYGFLLYLNPVKVQC